MQTSELEKKKNHLLGDEECINFRPSPNFKHMKKYLKSKFEESNSSPYQNSDPSTTPNSEEQETVRQQATSSSMAQRVQPPLPPNSPPPDFLVTPKQEVVDEEYNDRSIVQSQVKLKKEGDEKLPEKTMCRQFARGMCARGSTCIYAHEVILSQLPGVYTFCKNFQNTVCNFPKCRFVHATVFEKEHYFRTGYLPAHTLVHLKETNSALGPPLEGSQAEPSTVFSNPPPSMLPGVSSLPTSGNTPVDSRSKLESNGANLAAHRLASPVKRDWNDHELSLAAHVTDTVEPMLKKCKSCDSRELRLQCAMTKRDKAVESLAMCKKQKLQILDWHTKINRVLDDMNKSKMTNTHMFPSSAQSEPDNQQTRNNENFSMLLKLLDKFNYMDPSIRLLFGEIMKKMNEKKSDSHSQLS